MTALGQVGARLAWVGSWPGVKRQAAGRPRPSNAAPMPEPSGGALARVRGVGRAWHDPTVGQRVAGGLARLTPLLTPPTRFIGADEHGQ